VSNFLTGLVRRGAGLPLPVTILPAHGPQQIPASVTVSSQVRELAPEENQAESPVSNRSVMNTEIKKADSAGPPLAIQLPERAPSDVVEVTALHPRMERPIAPQPVAPSPDVSATFAVLERRPVSRRAGMYEKPSPAEPISTQIRPAPEAPEILPPSRAVREGSPPLQPPRRAQESQAAVRQDAARSVVPLRPVPKQEQLPVARPSQPAASAAAIASRGATPEKRSIQVKIGKVEIRSSQPAPVVRTTRPPSTGGFDDFKLARNYLDRNPR
jgi:hypothetical protein